MVEKKAICAWISIVCTIFCALAIITGILFIVVFAVTLDNWGYIILGTLILGFPPLILGPVAVILSAIAFARKERRRVTIVSLILSTPIFIFGIILLISSIL